MTRGPTWGSVIAAELGAVKDDPRSLRRFGVTMGVALLVLGGVFLWREGEAAPYLFALGAIFLVLAFAAPGILRPVQRVWMAFAIVLGWIMTRVLLVAVFFVGITPVALVARVCRKHFLELDFEQDRESYWEKKPAAAEGVERYERQF